MQSGIKMKGMTKVNFHLESAGYCEANRAHALRNTSRKTIKFYATYVHIQHATYGHILFDTGYTRRFYECTKNFPFSLYTNATIVHISEENEAKYTLLRKGVHPEQINFIIISHFHADHIGGLRDFPNAQFICSELAYEDVKNRKGFSAVRRGYLPDLMPEDFELKTRFLSFNSASKNVDKLGKVIDLFDDGSILICELGGHAKGQIGALLNADKKTLLVSDAAWLKENYTKLHLPSPIVRLFFDSWKDYKISLKKIHEFHRAFPEVQIIPCHCEETFQNLNHKR